MVESRTGSMQTLTSGSVVIFVFYFIFFFFSFPLSSKNVRWKLDEGLIFEGEKIESEKMERSFFVRNDRETGTVDDRLRGSADDNVLVTSVTSC